MPSEERIPEYDCRRHMRIVEVSDISAIDTDSESRLTAMKFNFRDNDKRFVCPACGKCDTDMLDNTVKVKRVPGTENVIHHIRFKCGDCGAVFETDPAITSERFYLRSQRKVKRMPVSTLVNCYFISDLSELKKCKREPVRRDVEIEIATGVAVGILLGMISLVLANSPIEAAVQMGTFMVTGGIVANANFWRRKRFHLPDTSYSDLEELLHKTKAASK